MKTTPTLLQWSMILLLIASPAFLAGCRHKTAQEDIYTQPDDINEGKVVGLDGLGKDLKVDTVTIRRDENQAMVVSVPVRLDQPEDRAVQYRFLFFAADGKPLRQEMPWRYMVMPARVQVYMTGASTTDEAVDWKLQIRRAR